MNYKDCIIVTKGNRGIALRATKLTVQNNDQVIVIYDDKDIMGIFSMSEVKAVIFAHMDDEQMVQSMMDAITDNKVDREAVQDHQERQARDRLRSS